MAESLRQKQSRFVRMVGLLIQYADQNGYELTFGDCYRDPRVHGKVGEKKSYSAASSKHKSRLAVDFNLFRNGRYLTSTASHKPLGEYWESLAPDASWGGRFKTPDGNHYSLGER